MRRNLLGTIAATCLVAGAAMHFIAGDTSSALEWKSGLLRSGAMLGAIWLAMPEFKRPGSRWVIAALVGLFVLMAVRPRLFLYAAVATVIILILRPRIQRPRPSPNR